MKLITYYTSDMSISGVRCLTAAKSFGFDAFARLDIDHTYRTMNPVLSEQRGAGYWLWKPYILLREMMMGKDGDVIVYMDAGVEMTGEQKWLEGLDEIWIFGNMYEHEHWCKGDAMEMIHPGPYSKQVQASVIAVRVSEFSRRFVKEWLTWCEMPGLIDDSPSRSANRDGFREHRHDQAILTCVAYKYGIPLHYWCARYNDAFDYPKGEYRDAYPVCLNHHRKRNSEW